MSTERSDGAVDAEAARPAGGQNRDDTDAGWGARPDAAAAHDDWLRAQRPPHWE